MSMAIGEDRVDRETKKIKCMSFIFWLNLRVIRGARHSRFLTVLL